MTRILLWGLLAYIAYRIVTSLAGSRKSPSDLPRSGPDQAAATHQDPVCGVYVSEDDAVIGRYEGKRHFFCSHACLEKFREQLEHSTN